MAEKHRVDRFIQRVLAKDFEPDNALKMIQEKHTIDFGSIRTGCTQAQPSDGYYPQFFLDFFSVIGKPGQAISKRDGPIFDNIIVSFQRWSAPYGAKHISGIPFDMTGRTFRIAQAATRETWFIVMHPVTGEMSELPSSSADARRRREQAGERLLGEGVEPSWRLGGQESQRISSNRWMTFQERFMEGWAAWSHQRGPGSFWAKHEPAFHAYDYGANIEIEVNDELCNLPRERHYSIDEDSEDEIDGYECSEESSDETHQLEELSITDDRVPSITADTRGNRRIGSSGNSIDNTRYERILSECNGLRKLVSELEARFYLESITAVSYALAVYINSDRVVADNNGEASQAETRSLLIDRNMITREFASARDYTFYPQAFHPVYGNISSSRLPMFLDSLFAAMKGNISDRNEGADVLSFGYFQGYSNIKRS
ncbi:uncharacterized protein CTRU02_215820, partial [Colletotrichum truncatum]